ncbi:MAG: hypothetical protein BRC55_16525 [Cyanobacteria bacterium SW_8_48_13]|nr:MAG: hypothetical protein BRC55_16525 [Cyanobacteria bacterium SW_8_48_13]
MHNLIAALTLETFSVAKPPDTGNHQKAWIAQSESNPTETPRIGTYASPGPLNQESNTYWVETADGVVVIEAQWVLPEAQNAIEAIRASTDSPLAAIFITHPHSDHCGNCREQPPHLRLLSYAHQHTERLRGIHLPAAGGIWRRLFQPSYAAEPNRRGWRRNRVWGGQLSHTRVPTQ